MGNIEVVSGQISPDLNHSTAEADLTTVAELSRPGDADGLTNVRFDSKVEIKPAGYRDGCPVADVHIRLFASVATVYIAREVPQTACRYGAVMDHELKHVQIAQRALDDTAAAFRRRLTDSATVPPFQVDAWGQTATGYSLNSWLQDQTRMAIEYANDIFDKGNHELDVPAEGTRLQRMCEPAGAAHTDVIIGPEHYEVN